MKIDEMNFNIDEKTILKQFVEKEKRNITINLPKILLEAINGYCKKYNCSLRAFFTIALYNYIRLRQGKIKLIKIDQNEKMSKEELQEQINILIEKFNKQNEEPNTTDK